MRAYERSEGRASTVPTTLFSNAKYYMSIAAAAQNRAARGVAKWQDALRQEFTASVDAFLHRISTDMREDDKIPLVFVGVHVRRTDYEAHMKEKMIGKPVTKKYFESAMMWFKKRYNDSKVIFLMASDDTEWTKKMFQERSDVIFASSGYR